MALLMGFLLAALLGIFHHFAILFIRLFTPHIGEQKHRGILTAFLGLLIVHTIEIIGYAGAYKLIIDAGWWGSLSGDFDGSFYDLIYFSGINFFTQKETIYGMVAGIIFTEIAMDLNFGWSIAARKQILKGLNLTVFRYNKIVDEKGDSIKKD